MGMGYVDEEMTRNSTSLISHRSSLHNLGLFYLPLFQSGLLLVLIASISSVLSAQNVFCSIYFYSSLLSGLRYFLEYNRLILTDTVKSSPSLQLLVSA